VDDTSYIGLALTSLGRHLARAAASLAAADRADLLRELVTAVVPAPEAARALAAAAADMPEQDQTDLIRSLLDHLLAGPTTPGGTGSSSGAASVPPAHVWVSGIPGSLPLGASGDPEAAQGRMADLLSMAGQEQGSGKWQTTPLRLSVDQHERLKQWCQGHDFSMAVVVRGLVARFLEEQSRRGT